jgi:ATP/maltotriose-dependent transcriptional regulator MalT/DNA-binding SARP family transcriptional activator
LIGAIGRRFKGFGKRTRALIREVAEPSGHLHPIAVSLVQEIHDRIPEYFVLVLEDHHTVEDQDEISVFLDLFLTYVDENCHVILSSRRLPALPNLSLLVARRQAAGMSIDELRFTPDEVQALAHRNYGLELDADQASVLAEQTAGWITGLLLSAAPGWAQGHGEIALAGRVGVDLYDYLTEQVLDEQPEPLQDFMLASSVLDELSPEACSSVLQVDRSEELINQVRTRNLFITEFEGDVSRIRYHDLFRDFLQSRLKRQSEVRFRHLTKRAAEIYAGQGDWERAVSRYQALQEYESVAEIIDRMAGALYDEGRWTTLADWIDSLPDSLCEAHPDFYVHRANIHAERGEQDQADGLYEKAEALYSSSGDTARVAHIMAARSLLRRYQGQYDEAMEYCRQALAIVGGTTTRDQGAMALAYRNLGLCQLRAGDLAEGQTALSNALDLYEAVDAPYDVGLVYHDLGLSHELVGDLTAAVEHYRAALRRWRRLGNLAPWANTLNGLGVVYYRQADYDRALTTLTEARDKAQRAGDLRVEAYTWASLGDLHRDLGAYELARQVYTQALDVAVTAHVGFIQTYALDALGNVLRLQGNLVSAQCKLREAMRHAEEHSSDYEIALCYTSLGVLAGEEGLLEDARRQLGKSVALFEAGGFERELARAWLHRAHVAFMARDEEAALSDLESTLAVVVPLGLEQFVIVDGQRLTPLLEFGVERGIGGEVLPRILESIRAHRERVASRPEPAIVAVPGPALEIFALGRPLVQMDGEDVQWPLLRSRDLLYCLLQHRNGMTKEQIGTIFWPDHAPERLEMAFRSTLYRLRRVLSREVVVFEDGLYSFERATNYWYDVEEFDGLLDRVIQAPVLGEMPELLSKGLALYRGDYMEGTGLDWVEVERERLRRRYLFAMESLARQYADRRNLQQAIELYERLVLKDPQREAAYRGLMHCYYRLGDRAAAIRYYQACVEVLREELGLSPSPETEDLYMRIID